MSNNHPYKDKLTLYDIMIMFMLKAPDQRKAIAAVGVLYGPETVKHAVEYKHNFRDYQAWHAHLVAALDNAQEKVDATRTKAP